MSAAMSTHSLLTTLLVGALVAWRIHARFRRMIGVQKLSPWRLRITLTLFPALLLLLAWTSRGHPWRIAGLACAVAAGLALAVWGLRRTTFEVTPGRLQYTPHGRLGLLLSLLFVARIVWRGVEVYWLSPGLPHGLDDFGRSPLTLAVFGLLAGYQIGYALGLARWRRRVLRRRQAQAQETGEGGVAGAERSQGGGEGQGEKGDSMKGDTGNAERGGGGGGEGGEGGGDAPSSH